MEKGPHTIGANLVAANQHMNQNPASLGHSRSITTWYPPRGQGDSGALRTSSTFAAVLARRARRRSALVLKLYVSTRLKEHTSMNFLLEYVTDSAS